MKRIPVLLAGLVALAAACSGNDSPTGTTDATFNASLDQDVTNVTADAVVEDIDVMAGMNGDIGNFTSPPDGFGGMNGCSFVSLRFHCPPHQRDGLTVTRDVEFYDASDALQTGFDPLLTAKIHIQASVSGDVSHGNWSATIDRSRDITITGLAGTETTRTVNGTGQETVSRAHVSEGGQTRGYDLTGDATITDVVIPVRGTGTPPWPLSGTITRNWTITITDGPHAGETRTRSVTVTFDGTAQASAMTGDGVSFTINLANRVALPRPGH
jgi:hypothetical protein